MPNYERKTSDILISEQFRNILEIFKDRSEVARTLLYRRLNKELLVDDHINYICVSKNDPTRISYLTPERIDFISKSDTEDFWTASRRIACKPGSFVGKILKDIPQKEVENFANLYKTFASKKELEFKVVDGEDILKYYHQDNYFNQNGSLGNSCMKSESCQEYFDIYTQNPMISMLVVLAPNEKLIGRALLWDLGEMKVMDRIYTIQDDTYFHHISKWATDNGYIHKAYQNWQTTNSFTDGQDVIEKNLSVQLKSWDCDKYPYLDSFKWLDMKTGILSNFQPINFKNDDHSGDYRTLTTSCGGYEYGDYLAFCEIDREYTHRGEIVEVNGMMVNTRHCNYSDTLDMWILRNESTYSDDLEDYVYTDMSRMDKELVNKRIELINKRRNPSKEDKDKIKKSFYSFIIDSWPNIA
jgi:hypothetical protein